MILDQLRVPVWHFKAITNIDDLIALLMVHHVVIWGTGGFMLIVYIPQKSF